MKLIANLNLKGKLFLIFLILLIPLSFFSINTLLLEREKSLEVEETTIKLEETRKVSELLHNIQRERALSLGFYLSSGKKFSKRLKERRITVDQLLRDLEQFYKRQHASNSYIMIFSEIDSKRSGLDAMTIDSLEFENYYYNLVFQLSKKINENTNTINDAQIANQLMVFNDLLKAKLHLGVLRTIIIRAISEGRLTDTDLMLISSRRSLANVFKDEFIDQADPRIFKYYQDKSLADSAAVIDDFIDRRVIDANANLASLSVEDCYNKFTTYLDNLTELETFAMGIIESDLSMKKMKAERRLYFYMIFVSLMFLLAVLLSVYIIRNLLKSVNLLKVAADQVAEGETVINLPDISHDEMGLLANSFRKVVSKNNHLVEVARAIGQGDYDVHVQVDSERDALPNALNKMKVSLKKLSEEEKTRNWMLTGISELNDLMASERALLTLSSKIIEHTCHYIEAEVGAVYLMDDFSKLHLSGGYAFSEGELSEELSAQNLAFQAVKNKKLLRLDKVATEEFKVKTNFVNASPAEVVIIPLYLQQQAVGVIEVASRQRFSDEKIEYLERIAERISVTIVTLKADIKTAELLTETQAQAEELEVQQEELRQMNLELQSQKERLQESEEELRVNQEELEEKNLDLEEKAKLLEENFEDLNLKNQQLEDAKLAIQLQVDELQRVGKYKSEFLANMSHELRTPLNSILILAKLISENREKNLTDKQVEFANVIHDSGNDLLKLINEILDLAKIESGKLNLEIRPFALKELNTTPLFRQVAAERHITFEVNYAPGLPEKISSDKFRIEQVLKNLLSNAFKFTSEGGKVTMDVFKANKNEQFYRESLVGAEVIGFSVADTGIGISSEDQEVIFEAFRQADASTTRKFGGTGLGLSISRELANLLGGEIKVESEVGKGSKFTFYVPIAYSELNISSEPVNTFNKKEFKATENIKAIISNTEKLLKPGGERSILIIEDDKGFARILADFAEGKKIKPYVTHLGKEGLAMVKELKPSAVLLDIQLPDISGWEVLEGIKKDDSIKNIPVHIMSAYEFDNQVKEKIENYLPKPITLESLDKAFFQISNINKSEVKKVLIVEDNILEGNAVKELLEAHEITSAVVTSGDDAFKRLEREPYDCIILDMKLPGMGGAEILEKLKLNDKLSKIPVIIYSGKDFTEEEEFRLKKYVNAIVIKTEYSYKRLLDEVRLFLHKIQEKLPDFNALKVYSGDNSLREKKVLVVDDDSRNIYSLYNSFERESMNIIVANNGLEALARLEESPDIDIVLMDIMMPEMDGLECTRRIRANAKFANIPVIALTAKAMKEDKEKCLQAGASDYITKPVNVEKLLSLMRVWISRKENITAF